MDFKETEEKWQEFWESHPELYQVQELSNSNFQFSKQKKYILVEFPYPSGSGLHIGHAFTFTGGDVYARFKRMQGYNVLFPMGWDAFGLPTENYAIKMKRPPQEVTKENTDMFRSQMKQLAFSFDWDREINTTDPNYYKWTQWIFIQLFKKGLAYKQKMPINWCPSCKIGLANEEVIQKKIKDQRSKIKTKNQNSDPEETVSVCERCGAEVNRRNISQWIVKITEYADRLIEGLKETNFVEKVKTAQINWIGKSEGARIRFKIQDPRFKVQELEVFTTRPDTIYGATFMVISPEHALVSDIIQNPPRPSFDPASWRASKEGVAQMKSPLSKGDLEGFSIEAVKNYVAKARSKSDLERTELNKEKTGVFSGLYTINPATGKDIPIWISDFVLASYGTGAIMAVPAHDERDFAFAKKFGLEVMPVIEPSDGHDFDKAPYVRVESGKMINSPRWNGLTPSEAIEVAIRWVEDQGIGEKASSYHMRDWIFSRQHYWGEPIPMIFCQNCAENHGNFQFSIFNFQKYAGENNIDIEILKNNPGWYPVPEDQLPVKLPEVEHYEPTDTGESPLATMTEWVKTKCPVCGGEAKRETDTMPNWAGSDWYYMRYIDPINDMEIANMNKMKEWLPVDVYIGGDEHNTLHLLYSRFIYKFLFDLGVVPAYAKATAGKPTSEPYYKRMSHGVILGPDGQRMSKSRGNVIVPDKIIEKYGVDVVRAYLMFMGPFEGTMAWNEKTLLGVKRFLDRFTQFINFQFSIFKNKDKIESESGRGAKIIINKTIKGVTRDVEEFGYNTAIAKLMELINQLSVAGCCQLGVDEIKTIIKLIAPVAPYMAEELWSRVRGESDPISVHIAPWPVAEEKYLMEETITVPVAVNGKVRGQLEVESQKSRHGGQAPAESKEEIIRMAKELDKIRKWVDGKEIVKEIYIEGKMINLVIK